MRDALVSAFLVHALDPGTCLKLGMTPGSGLAGASSDQLVDYMRPWGQTAAAIPCRKIVLHDGLPMEVQQKFPAIEFVVCPSVRENAWLARYRLLADWLPRQPIDRLFFSDINDVGVYHDPFRWAEALPAHVLWVGEEWTPFGANPWFTEKYDQFPPAWRALFETELAGQYPASAGLIGGRTEVLLGYVRQLVQLFDEQRERLAEHPLTAWDMMALNYLLFTTGPFVGFKQRDLPADDPLAGGRLRQARQAAVYRSRVPNPFLHDRKETSDRLPAVYDSWCTSRVLEQLRDHPRRERLTQLLSEPRCWGPEREYSPIDRCGGLADLVLTMFPRRGQIVETGRYWGVSTECLALLLPEAQITSVDNCDHEAAFPRLAGYANVRTVRADAVEFARSQQDGSIAAVYIDNDHSYDYVSRELAAWRSKLVRGGVFAGHDYSAAALDVVRAVHDFFGCPPHRVASDSSWGYVLL